MPDINEDPATAAKIKQEYEEFMQQMKNFGMPTGGEDQGLDNLTSMRGGLLSQLGGDAGMKGVNL